MSDKVEAALRATVFRLLKPLVRVLMRHGMSYGNFAELARRAYVAEALDHLERSGKRPTISGAAALTGLTRKEAKRLNDMSDQDTGAGERYNRAVRVITGWVQDERFHDEAGEPAVLPVEGEAPSFAALVREFSGDIPHAAMLGVLQASQNVSVIDGRVHLKARAYVPMATPIDKIDILGADVAELVSSIGHNLEAPDGERWFQRKVSYHGVRADSLKAFRELSNTKSQALLEEYFTWLSQHAVEPEEYDSDESAYVAVGIYYSESSDPEGSA